MKCEHETSMIEKIKLLEWSYEGKAVFLCKEICQDCGQSMGFEKHIYNYSHYEEMKWCNNCKKCVDLTSYDGFIECIICNRRLKE